MKKYLKIIYITFIFGIFFCLGLTNINADELEVKTLDYSNFEEYYNTYATQLDKLTDYLKDYNSSYYYFIYFTKSNFNVYLIEKSSYVTATFSYDTSSVTLSLGKSLKTLKHYSISFTSSNFETNFNTLKTAITNESFTSSKYGLSSSSAYGSSYYGYYPIMYYTNFENFVLNSSNTYALQIGDTIYQPGDVIPTYYEYALNSNLNLKKEFTHKYNNNTLKYIDLYFDNNDYGKTINFKLDIIDNSDYSLCDGSSDFVNGNSCVKPELIRTQMAFLEDYGNGLYKWSGGITLGDTIDYTIKSNDNGFTITGKINLDHDLNLFNYKKIRVSFNLGSAYNVTYSYSDNSTITSNNIDEYYSWMMLLEEQRLNRIDYNYTKYTILTTNYETFSSDILVEYVNTSKYLFVEYFDTELSTYLENGNIYSTPNYINNRDIEKFSINIGTSNNRGVYLLNHLKNEELSTSKYYFYIPEDLYFSQTESLENSIYIDNTGANNTNGVIAKPDDNYEDSSFANDFFNTFQNNDFGLSAVISSPLKLIQQLNSNTCATIDLTLPYINKSLQLPCMTEIYDKNFGELFNLYQIITTGFVAYWVSVRIYALVKSFKNPEDDKIEVMDL